MALLWAFLTFALCGGGTYALLERRARRDHFRERLAQAMRAVPAVPLETGRPAHAAPPRAEQDWETRLGRALRRAGLQLRPSEFILLWLACPLLLALLAYLPTRLPLVALLLGLLGASLPPLILRAGEDGRRRRFDAQLVDALTLLIAALRSGYSLPRAVQTVAEEMPPPISEEFGTALGELALGTSLAAALAGLAERVGSTDVALIVTAVTTQQQVGGNLAEILGRIAGTIRERVRVQGEVLALTAEGKLSSLILILLPPALALALMLRNPHYFRPLMDSPVGRIMIGCAIAGQVIGAWIIRRQVRLDV